MHMKMRGGFEIRRRRIRIQIRDEEKKKLSLMENLVGLEMDSDASDIFFCVDSADS